MVNVNSGDTLELGDGDTLEIGDYEIYYNSQEDRWEVKNSVSKRSDGDIHGADYINGKVGDKALSFNSDGKVIDVFNGEGDYVQVGGAGKSNIKAPLTISTWVWVGQDHNLGGSIGEFDPIGKYDGDGYIFRHYEGGLEFWFDGTGHTSKNYSPNREEWIHWAVVWDGSTIEYYTNGTSLDTVNTNDSITESDVGLKLMQRGDNAYFAQGRIDDVRIYDRALSSSEVTALYNYGNDGSSMPPTDGLVAHYDFEQPEDPNTAVDTSTITHVPKNSSGSLFPTDLGDVLQGKALADDGNIYDSVQTAVDNATGYVFIGPGTFNESVTVSTAGMMIEGSGYDTRIDGGTTGHAIDIQAANVTVQDLSVKTTSGGGNNYDGLNGNSNSIIQNIGCTESSRLGLTTGKESIISDCRIGTNVEGSGVVAGNKSVVKSCVLNSPGFVGILANSHDCVISSNLVNGTDGSHGINADADCVIIGNRIHSAGDDGIRNTSNDVIMANNRISDSGGSNITDTGSGTVKDDNLKGSAN
jgi:hypothetical protein